MDDTLKLDNQASEMQGRRTWERPTLTFVGTIREAVEGGTGKASIGGDPGDTLKPPG